MYSLGALSDDFAPRFNGWRIIQSSGFGCRRMRPGNTTDESLLLAFARYDVSHLLVVIVHVLMLYSVFCSQVLRRVAVDCVLGLVCGC